jgi:hypothetical protein
MFLAVFSLNYSAKFHGSFRDCKQQNYCKIYSYFVNARHESRYSSARIETFYKSAPNVFIFAKNE